MKKILIKLIKLYKRIPGPWHSSCRYIPTCSDYAIEAIDTYGSFKGGIMWGGSGYDPVIKEDKNEKNC